MSGAHRPVMLSEVVSAIAPYDHGIYVDGTFGRGGYTQGILQAANCSVYAIDRDPAAIAAGQNLVREFAPRLTLLAGRFGTMHTMLSTAGVKSVDGVTLDLGVSSPQLDEADRGFSFQADGPLDMRMGAEGETAADLVNTLDEKQLADIIFNYGEERLSRRVARQIVSLRQQQPFTRTKQLADAVRKVVPRAKDGIDPATRTFQALRIAVNDELGELKRGLIAAVQLLKPQGRLVIVSFHSLEDRAVKNFFRAHSASAPQTSRHIPANDSFVPSLRLITKKPLEPSEDESNRNPRARSAKLRIAERTDAPFTMENAA
jgi:16S rRNA (cytosine1402-N4)-methyltransferase